MRPRGAGVLALHPDRAGALLEIARLVDDQDRARIAEVLPDVVTQVIPDAVLVPDRVRQQTLHPTRVVLTHVLGDRPAVRPRQLGQQPLQERRDPAPRLDPPEAWPDARHQLLELRLPPIKVIKAYAGGSSHRKIRSSPHKPG